MNEIELATLFCEYAETARKLAELKAQIEAEVLERNESVKIAGVTATYYKLSHETPDYEAAAKMALYDGFDLSPYQTTTISVAWKNVCDHLGVKAPEGAAKPARVVVK